MQHLTYAMLHGNKPRDTQQTTTLHNTQYSINNDQQTSTTYKPQATTNDSRKACQQRSLTNTNEHTNNNKHTQQQTWNS